MCALPMPNFYRGIPSATIWNIVWSGRWNTEAHYHRLYTCFMIWALTSCKNKNSKINFFLFLKLTASNLIILISFRIPACLPVDKINLLSFLRIQPATNASHVGFLLFLATGGLSSFWFSSAVGIQVTWWNISVWYFYLLKVGECFRPCSFCRLGTQCHLFSQSGRVHIW